MYAQPRLSHACLDVIEKGIEEVRMIEAQIFGHLHQGWMINAQPSIQVDRVIFVNSTTNCVGLHHVSLLVVTLHFVAAFSNSFGHAGSVVESSLVRSPGSPVG